MDPVLAAVIGVLIGGAFVAPLVPLLRSCSRPVGIAALGVAMMGVAIFTLDLASVADLVQQTSVDSVGFASIVRGAHTGALGGAALIGLAALLATLDVRRAP
jgi:hypothetical protein